MLVYGCLWSSTTHNTEDARPNIVDAVLTLIFRMWLGAWVFLFCTSRRLIGRKRTVTYHVQYFMINSRISECDHKCETRNAEQEIGTDGSSQTWRNPQVDGYVSGFAPPRVCGSGFWPVLEPNRPVFAVQTRTAGGLPGPIANTNWVFLFARTRITPSIWSNMSLYTVMRRCRVTVCHLDIQRVQDRNGLKTSMTYLILVHSSYVVKSCWNELYFEFLSHSRVNSCDL